MLNFLFINQGPATADKVLYVAKAIVTEDTIDKKSLAQKTLELAGDLYKADSNEEYTNHTLQKNQVVSMSLAKFGTSTITKDKADVFLFTKEGLAELFERKKHIYVLWATRFHIEGDEDHYIDQNFSSEYDLPAGQWRGANFSRVRVDGRRP